MNLRSLASMAAMIALAAGCAVAPQEEEAGESEDAIALRHAPVLGPDPRGAAVKNPIVLVHGFAASTTFNGFSDDIYEALQRAHGANRVFRVNLPAFVPPTERAKELKRQIIGFVGEETRVNIIAHSMGGLDSRHLVSPRGLEWGSHVASITTISTPHRGSDLAGWLRDSMRNGSHEAIANTLLRGLGAKIGDDSRRADIARTLEILSPEGARRFDSENPDDGAVTYFSWAGVSSVASLRAYNPNDITDCEPGLANPHHVLAPGRPRDFVRDELMGVLVATAFRVAGSTFLTPNANRAHDGIVRVEDAKHGTFMGCIPADHADEVGVVFPQLRRTGYEPVRFYLNVAYDLAARGF